MNDMVGIVNELLTLIVQLAGIVFSIGIAVYAFRYPILREGAVIMPEVAVSQHDRLRKKILQLFWIDSATIFASILVKVILPIFKPDIWVMLVLICVLLLLSATFMSFYSLFVEIGLVDERSKKIVTKEEATEYSVSTSDNTLVEIAGGTVLGTPSGLKAQHAQAELTRRLMVSIKNLDVTTSRYSKVLVALTIALTFLGVLQIILTLFSIF